MEKFILTVMLIVVSVLSYNMFSYAKSESQSYDAESVVAYGKYTTNNAIIALNVDSNGVVQLY